MRFCLSLYKLRVYRELRYKINILLCFIPTNAGDYQSIQFQGQGLKQIVLAAVQEFLLEF